MRKNKWWCYKSVLSENAICAYSVELAMRPLFNCDCCFNCCCGNLDGELRLAALGLARGIGLLLFPPFLCCDVPLVATELESPLDFKLVISVWFWSKSKLAYTSSCFSLAVGPEPFYNMINYHHHVITCYLNMIFKLALSDGNYCIVSKYIWLVKSIGFTFIKWPLCVVVVWTVDGWIHFVKKKKRLRDKLKQEESRRANDRWWGEVFF